MKQELWYIIVDGVVHGNDAAVGNFYGYGEHLGEAIDRVLAAAPEVGFSRPRVSEVAPVALDEHTVHDIVALNANVLYSPNKYFYPLADYEATFVLPGGVVYNANPGTEVINPDSLITAFHACNDVDENGEYLLTLSLSRPLLRETLFTCLGLLYPINGLFLRLRHWDGGPDDIWFIADDNPDSICAWLTETAATTIDNGFIEVAVTASERARRTSVILSPHKTIQIRSRLKPVHSAYIGELRHLGFRQTDTLQTLENGAPHFHYRPGNALSRSEFEQWMATNGFEYLAFEETIGIQETVDGRQ